MKPLGVALLITTALLSSSGGALAAEYQGQNIDGELFEATAYSYETGGLYDIQVRFNEGRATMVFAGGSEQTIRLNQPVITDLNSIEGWRRGFLTLGGLFSIGVADNSDNNLEPPRPRPLEGFWRISLKGNQPR
ncbi:MAG: hypothetical protein ACFCU8_05880 [Thermosynechococcaceae cyanobacterium]